LTKPREGNGGKLLGWVVVNFPDQIKLLYVHYLNTAIEAYVKNRWFYCEKPDSSYLAFHPSPESPHFFKCCVYNGVSATA
jgi:hypothetical protein